MNQELQQHKKSDTVKWILTLIAFILIGILLVGIICGWFDRKEAESVEEEESSQAVQNMVLGESVGHNMSLSSVRSAEPAAQALESVTLTATVKPDNTAENTGVDWTIKWQNAASAWAEGKAVTDYVTVTPQGSGYADSKTVTLTNLQAFGEQIVVTAISRDNPEITASCTVDYAQSVENFTLSFGTVNCNFGGTTNVTVELNANGTPAGGSANFVSQESEVYTIATDVSVTYQLTVAGMYNSENKPQASYWLTRLGNAYGVYSYAQFFSYTEAGNYDSVSYQTLLNYSVAQKGLYFGIEYMVRNMGLTFSSGGMSTFPTSSTDYSPSGLVELIAGPKQIEGNIIEYTNTAYDMFTLTVTAESKKEGVSYGSLTKSTNFHMGNYTNTSAISAMELDQPSIVF